METPALREASDAEETRTAEERDDRANIIGPDVLLLTAQESAPKKTQQTDQDAVSTEPPTPALIPFPAAAIGIVIRQQRRRSGWLRTFAFLLLIMVVVSICLAIYLLTNASQLTGSDFQNAIAKEREIRDRELGFLDREIDNLSDQISHTTTTGPHLEELTKTFEELLDRRNEVLKKSTDSIIRLLSAPPLSVTKIDISSLTVRVSSIILLIFLVQTFINVFRYVTRRRILQRSVGCAHNLC
jgi:hypothetical protein